jgi:hypothetical protein
VLVSLALSACASTGPVSIGPDTYMLGKPGDFFTLSGASVEADLYREAGAFCSQQGKQVQSLNAKDSDAGIAQYASAEIRFRCLAAGDPALKSPVGPADVTVRVQSDQR